ncbi:MAG TPA: aldo/keto reductase [Steroidobacteraceae bacterium]|jgi:diketogulonate reductase-like aldo/keto reductase|nr:aldo/keto reductase [Steroidobacteraceae bacterium]
MKTVTLPSGERVPAFGMGTYRMAETRSKRAAELATLRLGLDLGITVIDTAEMYGEGAAEEMVAEAIHGRRDGLFIVTKVYPHNASREGTIEACERSLHRLGTDRIDLYLLHWRGSEELADTLEAFVALQKAGKIRHYGVSNFDVSDLEELWSAPGGAAIATNQVLYNLMRRGIEWSLLPWMHKRHVPVMAYSPIEEAQLARNRKLADYAQTLGMTPSQLALAWLLAKDDVMVIPKTGNPDRLRENLRALDFDLTAEHLAQLDKLFPPPARPRPLEMR